jgi:hypothetical protein
MHSSAVSQAPVEPRQIVPEAMTVSPGQAVALPVHVSAISQPPATGRQVAPGLPAAWPHAPPPSQASMVQALLSSAHAVPLTVLFSVQLAVPLHCRVWHVVLVHVIEVPPQLPALHTSV